MIALNLPFPVTFPRVGGIVTSANDKNRKKKKKIKLSSIPINI